jgi:hypothetical protein
MPAGMRCGHIVGNGAGGYIGNSPGQLEPWHIEAAGTTTTTHPDFKAVGAKASLVAYWAYSSFAIPELPVISLRAR